MLPVLVVLTLVATPPAPALPACAQNHPPYVLPTSADEKVLMITGDSRQMYSKTHYSVFTDGRITYREGEHTRESWLPEEDLRALLETALGCGLGKAQDEQLREAITRSRPPGEIVKDGGTVTVRITLEEVTYPGESARRPFRHSVSIESPPSETDLGEIKALHFIWWHLQQLIFSEPESR